MPVHPCERETGPQRELEKELWVLAREAADRPRGEVNITGGIDGGTHALIGQKREKDLEITATQALEGPPNVVLSTHLLASYPVPLARIGS
jgi:hypothetical protein